MLRAFIQPMQSASATQAPVIEAVRVPPSAWSTSQSTVIWRSPSASRSSVARKRAADQALDFDGAAVLLAGGGLAAGALQRGARQHAVFGGDPAAALALEPRRQAFFQRGRDQHMGVAEFHHAGAFGIFDDAAFQRHGAQFIRRTAAWPHGKSSEKSQEKWLVRGACRGGSGQRQGLWPPLVDANAACKRASGMDKLESVVRGVTSWPTTIRLA